jgi:hypothetical protein
MTLPPDRPTTTRPTAVRRLLAAAGVVGASLGILLVLAGGAAAIGLGVFGLGLAGLLWLVVLAGLLRSVWADAPDLTDVTDVTDVTGGVTDAPPRRG